MTRYIAFLRAINVGGHVVKMDRLREIFEARKLRNVETFIASGNVIFDTRVADAAALERTIEEDLRKILGYEVATFFRTPAELATIATRQPFGDQEATPAAALWIGFMRTPLGTEALQRLATLATDVDEFRAQGREAYWLRRPRTTEPEISGPRLEKALRAPITFRNATTVRKLVAKYAPG